MQKADGESETLRAAPPRRYRRLREVRD